MFKVNLLQPNEYAVDDRNSALLLLHRDALEVKDGSYKFEDSRRAILALRSVIRITLDGINQALLRHRLPLNSSQSGVCIVFLWRLEAHRVW